MIHASSLFRNLSWCAVELNKNQPQFKAGGEMALGAKALDPDMYSLKYNIKEMKVNARC